MIGSYGRHAYAGRAGKKRNRKVNTISPKGGKIILTKPRGSVSIGKSVGKVKKNNPIGNVINS